MMYEKCQYCINAGKICQGIVASSLCTLLDLETTTNYALQFSRQITKDDPVPIKIKMNFTCLNFIQKENNLKR